MKFLLTNDDGVDAPGIAALARAVEPLGAPLIIAPDGDRSGVSHRTTTTEPVRIERLRDRWFATDGMPADCVRLGLHRFRDDFDVVLAGINSGGNLGADVFHSGTVAAAREAVLHGVRGIAISHYRNRPLTEADWERVTRWVRPILEDLLGRDGEPNTLWNVNLPCLDLDAAEPEAVECPLDLSPLPLNYRENGCLLHYCGEYQQRARKPGSDVDVCFGGRIALTHLRLTY